jgi:hypothetical protein
MAFTPIPFAVQSYQNRSLPVSAQRCLNLFAESVPSGKKPVILYGSHGLKTWATLATIGVQGIIFAHDKLYAITKTRLYSVSSAGVATELATISISGPVSIIKNVTQIRFTDGTNDYTWNNSTSTLTDMSGVTNWSASNTLDYIDTFAIQIVNGTDEWRYSDSDDFATIKAEYAAEESSSDDLIAVRVNHREVWLFGTETIGIWYNAGLSGFTFERNPSGIIEKGCTAPRSIVELDNTFHWLGEDGIFYRADGYSPMRISTVALEVALKSYTTTTAFAFGFYDEGHAFYQVTFPDDDATWVYDVSTGLWHERSYFNSTSGSHHRHRAQSYAKAYGMHLVGDWETGEIHDMSLEHLDNNGEEIQAVATSPVIHLDGNRFTLWSFQLDMETGVGLTSGQGSDPQAMLSISKDGGRTFGAERWKTFGKIGTYLTRAIWRQLGQYRDCVLQLKISDPVKRVIIGARAEIERDDG